MSSELVSIFLDALKECAPERLVANILEPRDGNSGFAVPIARFNEKVASPSRLWLFGAGKAAPRMVSGVLDKLGSAPRGQIAGGVVIAPEGLEAPKLGAVLLVRGSHPKPNLKSSVATEALLENAARLSPRDHVIFVLSGGASALLEKPAPGVSLDEIAEKAERMMAEGRPIEEINAERKRLSSVKGGKLAAAFPCPVTVFVLSDVAQEPFQNVGSGPLYSQGGPRHVLVADRTTLAEAAGRAAARTAAAPLVIEPGACDGEVSALARDYAARVRAGFKGTLIRTGEPVVRASGSMGRGGRSQHLAIFLARELAGVPGWRFLAAGSDGIDGSSSAAGAVVDGQTWERAAPLDGPGRMAEFDTAGLHEQLGTAIVTGQTGCNLQDLHVLTASAIAPRGRV
jgi:hydroxypyruvate reductase